MYNFNMVSIVSHHWHIWNRIVDAESVKNFACISINLKLIQIHTCDRFEDKFFLNFPKPNIICKVVLILYLKSEYLWLSYYDSTVWSNIMTKYILKNLIHYYRKNDKHSPFWTSVVIITFYCCCRLMEANVVEASKWSTINIFYCMVGH